MLIDLMLLLSGVEDTLSFIYYDNIYGWIRVLVEFYIVFFLTYKLLNKRIKNNSIDIIICTIVLIRSLTDYLYPLRFLTGWQVERIGFVIGLLIYKKEKQISQYISNKYISKCLFHLSITIILGLAYLKFKSVYFVGEYLIRCLLEISFLLLIVILTTKIRFGNEIVKELSKYSYEIYLAHPLSFSIINCMNQKSSNVYIALVFILTGLISILIKNWTKLLIKTRTVR